MSTKMLLLSTKSVIINLWRGNLYQMNNYLKENKDNKSKSLGEIIKERRESFNYSQREIARKLKIDNSGLAKVEKGERKKPSVMFLTKISLLLRIDLTFLMKKAGYAEEEIKIANSEPYFYYDSNEILEKMIKDKRKKIDKATLEKSMFEKLLRADIIFNVIDETGNNQIEISNFLKEQIKERDNLIIKYQESIDKMTKVLNINLKNKDK